LVTLGLVTLGLVTLGLVTLGLVTLGLVTLGLVTLQINLLYTASYFLRRTDLVSDFLGNFSREVI